MVLFPKVGALYWIVTDFYETFCAIPVTLESKGGLFRYSNKTPRLYTVRWDIRPPRSESGFEFDHKDGYSEIYDASRSELYRTQRRAESVAAKMNMEARQQ